MTQEETDLHLLQAAASALSEHFDSIQILATRYDSEDEGGTVAVHCGRGNLYARIGQMTQWLEQQKEYARMAARADEETDE